MSSAMGLWHDPSRPRDCFRHRRTPDPCTCRVLRPAAGMPARSHRRCNPCCSAAASYGCRAHSALRPWGRSARRRPCQSSRRRLRQPRRRRSACSHLRTRVTAWHGVCRSADPGNLGNTMSDAPRGRAEIGELIAVRGPPNSRVVPVAGVHGRAAASRIAGRGSFSRESLCVPEEQLEAPRQEISYTQGVRLACRRTTRQQAAHGAIVAPSSQPTDHRSQGC